jgi:hypothetical protein
MTTIMIMIMIMITGMAGIELAQIRELFRTRTRTTFPAGGTASRSATGFFAVNREGRFLRRAIALPLCLVVAGLSVGSVPDLAGAALAEPAAAEPTREDCMAEVGRARALIATLPADHLSRRFAESHLYQAMVEANNGEFDDCLQWAERATVEARELPHALRSGETLKIRRPEE